MKSRELPRQRTAGAGGGPGREPLDPAHQIETPESTVLALPVAGIGPRSIAYLVDLTLRLMSALSVLFVLSLVLVLTSISSATFAAMTIAVFVLQWAYFVLFEGLLLGRTPGKMIAGVRVVSEDGTPITLVQAAVRNLLRVVDFLPGFYGIGLTCAFISPAHRRVGDVVGGTVVVRDGVPLVFPDPVPAPVTELEQRASLVRVSSSEIDLLRRADARRQGMTLAHRNELSARLFATLAERLAAAGLEAQSPEERWDVLRAVLRHGKPPGREDRDALLARCVVRWRRLALLLGQAGGRRVARCSPADLRELGILYRRASADLAYVQTFLPRDPILAPLQELVMQAHQLVYKPRAHPLTALANFYAERFPRVFRESLPTIQSALLLFLGFFALGLCIDLVEPRLSALFLSAEMIEGMAAGRLWTDPEESIFGSAPGFASAAIANNNVTVSFLAFAGGIFLGAGSLYILAVNGLMLGAIFSATARHGMLGALLTFIAAHGPLELSIIVMSAAAGLLLARAVVLPGPYARSAALTIASRDAFVLVGAAVPGLAVAGIVEGFVSPSTLPLALKIALGLLLLVAFVALGLRTPRPAAA